jgi:zinc/manganese transport system permease protein
LAVRHLRGARGLAWGYGIGLAGYASGILLSAVVDLPTGAVIVCTMAIMALLGAAATRIGRGKSAATS